MHTAPFLSFFIKAFPLKLPKYPLNNGQFFQGLMKKSKLLIKFDPYGAINDES